MPVNTPYLSASTTAGVVNTPFLPTGLTGISSDVSSLGTVFANGFVSRGVTSFSSNLTIAGTLAVGGGLAVKAISQITFSTATVTVTATKSVESNFAFANLAANDVVLVGPPSAISDGLAVNAYCSSAGTATIRWSNVSTANAVVALGQVYRLTAIRY